MEAAARGGGNGGGWAGRVAGAEAGRGEAGGGPWGRKRQVSADWAASGRALLPVERGLVREVLPLYANSHTAASRTGLQTTCFVNEARQAAAESFNARITRSDRNSDVVLFTGHGSTGAINKMVQVLGLHRPHVGGEDSRPVVFVGPHEHHSNLLPWRESCAEVIVIPEDAEGRLCRATLADTLRRTRGRPLRIGAFSACSNVTGVVADVDAITEQLHRGDCLAFWDYAGAAQHIGLDMNPVVADPNGGGSNPWVYKDAAFVSLHKFPGGPGCPGLLLAKRRLFINATPSEPGGGTVFFVTERDHRYLSNREHREQGGTQDIPGQSRAGLMLSSLRAAAPFTVWRERDEAVARRLLSGLAQEPAIALLGPELHPRGAHRVPVTSFLVRAPPPPGSPGSRWLHPAFVCAILADVFGVQSRAGCMCAGPYGLRLLGISEADQTAIEAHLADQLEVLRPGFTRLSPSSHAPEWEIDYIVGAARAVARDGWRLLPHYRFDPKTGEWKHRSRMRRFQDRKWLEPLAQWPRGGSHVSSGGAQPSEASAEEPVAGEEDGRENGEVEAAAFAAGDDWESGFWAAVNRRESAFQSDLKKQLEEGEALLRSPPAVARGGPAPAEELLSAENHDSALTALLRWFMLPSEALALIQDAHSGDVWRGASTPTEVPVEGPVAPRQYAEPGTVTPWEPAPEDTWAGSAAGEASGKGPAAASNGADAGEGAEPVEIQRAPEKVDVERASSKKYPLRRGRAAEEGPAWTVLKAKRARVGVGSGDAPTEAAAVALTGGQAAPKRDKKTGLLRIPQKLYRNMAMAVSQWGMIKQGDKVLLGLSGGKDSLALLHCLLALKQKYPPGSWELACATVDPGSEAFNPKPLIPYLESLGVKYHYLETPIMEWAREGRLQGDSICAFCARMKRGALYTCCREHGYNKLAMAQHLDDQAESFFMSVMHNGLLRTMKANYPVDAGDIRVIRPLVYVREKELRDFSYAAGLPVIAENCPACFSDPKERAHIKKLLAKQETLFPALFSCLRRALTPLMDPALMDVTQVVSREVASMTDSRRRDRQAEARAGADTTADWEQQQTGRVNLAPEQIALLEALPERALLHELQRRARGERHGRAQGKKEEAAGAPGAPAATRDGEFEADLHPKQTMCTAEACARRAED